MQVRAFWTPGKAAALAVLVLIILMLLSAVRAHADQCGVGGTPCTLPCTASTTPSVIMQPNGKRTDLMVINTGATNWLYVILGQGAAGQDYTYGIPLAPGGGPGSVLDLQVQPDPNKGIHTWTSAVSVATSTGTTTCVYGELSQ